MCFPAEVLPVQWASPESLNRCSEGLKSSSGRVAWLNIEMAQRVQAPGIVLKSKTASCNFLKWTFRDGEGQRNEPVSVHWGLPCSTTPCGRVSLASFRTCESPAHQRRTNHHRPHSQFLGSNGAEAAKLALGAFTLLNSICFWLEDGEGINTCVYNPI